MSNSSPGGNREFWRVFGQALKAEPREATTIQGISGVEHNVESIAVDDQNKRLIIVSAEPNPRMAALMRVDIQSAMPDLRVLIVRPIAFDLPSIARQIVANLGVLEVDFDYIGKQAAELKNEMQGDDQIELIKRLFGGVFLPVFLAYKNVSFPPINQVFSIIQQLALFDWEKVAESTASVPSNLRIPIKGLLSIDSMAADLRYGVCPMPLYEMTERDWEQFSATNNTEGLECRLRELGVYQYFFPPRDQVILGVVDKTRATLDELGRSLNVSEQLGHPLAPCEITSDSRNIQTIIDDLSSMGLVVEGEIGLEITPAGTSSRAVVKFRPRESFLSKLFQSLKLNISLNAGIKDLLPPH